MFAVEVVPPSSAPPVSAKIPVGLPVPSPIRNASSSFAPKLPPCIPHDGVFFCQCEIDFHKTITWFFYYLF